MNEARRVAVDTADEMRLLGAQVGSACVGGDVVVLTGDLGAGKTTLTQGIAVGLGIRERVTSPTFVIARVHVNEDDGPDLVHVDAYRLSSLQEIDDLDLDSDLERSVVVVEWGAGMVDALSPSRVDIAILRSDDVDEDRRIVEFVPHSERWSSAVDAVTHAWESQ